MFFTCKEHYIGLEISILQEKPANKRIKTMIIKNLPNPVCIQICTTPQQQQKLIVSRDIHIPRLKKNIHNCCV